MTPEQAADDAALRWLVARGLVAPPHVEGLRRAALAPGGPGLVGLAGPRLRPEDAAELSRLRAAALERARAAASGADATLRLAPGAAAGLTPPPGPPPDDGATVAAPPPADARAPADARGPADASAPRRVGPYEVVRELARGGMGVVLVARRPGLDRQVALKLLLAGDAAGPEEVDRFLGEARIAARLKHPNIVGILDVGTDAGRPYLVMDLVDGASLKARLARGPLDPPEAARLARDVARALAYAHGQAVLHRDIKPHNILVTPDGAPVVTDFGLAKDVGTDAAGPTRTGQVMGTPAYMPPEQAEGQADLVDRRADIYSLGATLYELLVGRPPFAGPTPLNVITQVVSKDPTPPRALRPEVDRDLETVVLTCLEKEPDRRYPSAQALADDLDRWLADEPIAARRPTLGERLRRWGRRNRATARVAGAAAAVLLVGAAGGALAFVDARATARGEAEVARREAAREADERARIEERARVEAEARRRYDAAAAVASRSVAELDARLRPSARAALPIDRRLPLVGDAIGDALGLLGAAQRWRAVAPASPEAAARTVEAALLLARFAAEGEQWALAERALAEAEEVSAAAAAGVRREVDAAREARAGEGERVADELLGRAAAGALGEGALDEAALAIGRLPGARTVARVARALDGITLRLARTTRRALQEAVAGAEGAREVAGALDAWLGADGPEAPLARSLLALDPQPRRALEWARARLVTRAQRFDQDATTSAAGGLEAAATAVLADRHFAELGPHGAVAARLACDALRRLEDPAGLPAVERYLRVECAADRAVVAIQALVRLAPRDEVADRLAAALTARAVEVEPFLSGQLERPLASAGVPPEALAAALRRAAPAADGAPGAAQPAAGSQGAELPAPARAFLGGAPLDDAAAAAALAALEPLVEADPRLPMLWARSLGRERAGDLAGALADAERMVVTDPGDYRPWLRRANLRRVTGEVDGALADLDRALRIQPRLAIAWQLQAQLLLLERGDAVRAEEAASRALAIRDDLGAAWALRGSARVRLGQAGPGLQDLERATRVDPRSPLPWRLRAQARHAQGDLAGAEADASRAIDLARAGPRVGDWAELWVERAAIRLDRQRPREALEDLDAGPPQARRDPRSLRIRGNALEALGDVGRAREAFDALVAARPDDAWSYLHRAQHRQLLGDLPGALADARRGHQLAPALPEAGLAVASALAAQGARGEAQAALDAVVAAHPRHVDARIARAVLREQAGALEAALEDLQVAVGEEPDSPHVLLRRGALLVRLGRLAAAELDVQRTLELEPRSGRGLLVRTLLRLEQGRPVEAAQDVGALGRWAPDLEASGADAVRRWLEAHPDHPQAQAARERLAGRGR